MPVPILILSDAPDSGTGLGRITKDLAGLLSTMPEFRVGTCGRGGFGSRTLPWIQYNFDERLQWGETALPSIWEDFAQGAHGIIFTIWDASRLMWFGAPEYLSEGPVKTFLQSGRFDRWGYFPVDGHGPCGELSTLSKIALTGYDRVLAYSKFGQAVLRRTLDHNNVDFIPHGIDTEAFNPREPAIGRTKLGITSDAKLVGCVMTNQARKDWGTWAETAAKLLSEDSSYWFWAHIDALERYWSLPALIADFGLSDHVRVTLGVSDQTLSEYYSACDVTVLPSLGEGFGYPLAESLACGVPAIHHDYAAGHEILPEIHLGDQDASTTYVKKFRLDTLHNIYRPHLDFSEWATHIKLFTDQSTKITTGKECLNSIQHLSWTNLAPVWQKWFLDGLRGRTYV